MSYDGMSELFMRFIKHSKQRVTRITSELTPEVMQCMGKLIQCSGHIVNWKYHILDSLEEESIY
jgi:hypothetical protein